MISQIWKNINFNNILNRCQVSLKFYSKLSAENSNSSVSLINSLKSRGLIERLTSEKLDDLLESKKVTAYLGADPTAYSLHIGNLLPMMILIHLYTKGHNIIPVIGTATVQVGDPSGRKTERTSIEDNIIKNNSDKIKSQFLRVIENGKQCAILHGYEEKKFGNVIPQSNIDWWKKISMLDFMNKIGRHIRVQQMLARESVKQRLNSGNGLGFNEFSYQILQAYDFLHLNRTFNCSVQIGGSDQWGNITAGIDLISRMRTEAEIKEKGDVYGITVPLLTTPSGEKFGKSAGNAIFLDNKYTSMFSLYQYFKRVPDEVTEKYLKLFTFIPIDEIKIIIAKHNETPENRYAQSVLAREVTDMIHGIGSGKQAEDASEILYPSTGKDRANLLKVENILKVFKGDPFLKEINRNEVMNVPIKQIIKKLYPNMTSGEINRSLKDGGVYIGVNFTRVTDVKYSITEKDIIDKTILLIRVGKSNIAIVYLCNDK